MEFYKNKKGLWKIAVTLALIIFALFLSKPILNSVNYILGRPPAVVETRDIFFEQQAAIEGFRRYQNLLFKFTLQIPEELSLREYSEGNTTTLAFESLESKEKRGFQIFVVPYPEDTIREERFKMDVPSGVIIDQQNVVIDGVRGTMFFSYNSLLGETREVWFIHDGFLFEITARKELDVWLSEIMRTWKFLQFS